MTYVLGINAYRGDVPALLRDGELIAAVEEEPFRRGEYWAGFARESTAGRTVRLEGPRRTSAPR